jgi:DeoR family glycerol-3-phosphate regulon repressor
VTSFFDNSRADFGIFGVAGVAEDGALLDFHVSEVRVREKITMNCRTSVLVVDSSKFGRNAPAVGGSIFDVDRIIMDTHQNDDFIPLLERVGDRLVMAGGSTT